MDEKLIDVIEKIEAGEATQQVLEQALTPEILSATGMYAQEDAVDDTVSQMAELEKRPLNRRQRRLQNQQLRKIEKQLAKASDKAVDLPPEKKERVYRTLLARVKRENEKFEAMKKEEQE